MFFQQMIKKIQHTHQFHSCSTDLQRPSDWFPLAQSASAADCSRTASGRPCPPLETEENCHRGIGCKKKTFIKQMPGLQNMKKVRRFNCTQKERKKKCGGPSHSWSFSCSWAGSAGKHTLTMGQSFKYLRTLTPPIKINSQWGFSSRPQRSSLPGYCYPLDGATHPPPPLGNDNPHKTHSYKFNS